MSDPLAAVLEQLNDIVERGDVLALEYVDRLSVKLSLNVAEMRCKVSPKMSVLPPICESNFALTTNSRPLKAIRTIQTKLWWNIGQINRDDLKRLEELCGIHPSS